jgi:hypothetical protein
MRLALVLGLLLFTRAATAHAAPKVWNQHWAVAGTPEVKIVADDAHVIVHAGPAGSVSAKVSYELKRWGLVVGGGEPTVLFERQGERITITARDPKGFGVIGGIDENYTVEVLVPPTVNLNVRTGDGAMDCDPLSGTFQFRAGDGAIRAHGLKGSIDYSTGDGRVIMDDLDGKLSGRAGDGSARISGRFDVVDVASADGRIEVRAIKGSKATAEWSLETADGALKLDIPLDFAALLDCRTRDGSLRMNLPIDAGKSERTHQIMGELNGGGPRLRMRTGDGSLTIGASE